VRLEALTSGGTIYGGPVLHQAGGPIVVTVLLWWEAVGDLDEPSPIVLFFPFGLTIHWCYCCLLVLVLLVLFSVTGGQLLLLLLIEVSPVLVRPSVDGVVGGVIVVEAPDIGVGDHPGVVTVVCYSVDLMLMIPFIVPASD